MTNEVLLKRLLAIKNETMGNITLLSDLIADIKKELLTADMKTSDKQRFKTCLSYCEKIYKGNRPILAYTHHENGLQYYTDAWFMVELHDSDIMADLPRNDKVYDFKACKNHPFGFDVLNAQYPCVNNLINRQGDCHKVDLEKLYAFANANKNENVILQFGDTQQLFQGTLLLNALVWGNMHKGVADIVCNGGMRPLTIFKDNGTTALICPCRLDGIETHNIFVIE